MRTTGRRLGRISAALVMLVALVHTEDAVAGTYTVTFDPPVFATGSTITTAPGGVSFPRSPVTFAVPEGATKSSPNALRMPGNCPNASGECPSGDNRLTMDFAKPARSVGMFVGFRVPGTCFELDCPIVQAAGFDEPSHTLVALSEPKTVTSSSITVPLTLDAGNHVIDRVIYAVGEDPRTGSHVSHEWTAQIDDLSYDVAEDGDPPDPGEEVPPPQITIDSPVEGQQFASDAVSLRGRVQSAVEIGGFCVSVDNDTDIPNPCDRTGSLQQDGTFDIPRVQGLHEGTNRITVWAQDARAQVGKRSVTIEIRSLQPFTVMTYNVQLRPGPVGTGDEYDYGLDERRRAGLIGERVLDRAPDVVAFNEVFDEDGREFLVRKLRNNYPYRATKIASLQSGPLEDSGLALFSKFPFLTFRAVRAGGDHCVKGKQARCRVAFRPFGFRCNGTDCASEKGVAYAKVDNPRTARPLHLFFTHADAGRELRDRRARRSQLAVLINMIDQYTDPRANEDTIVMGDLNIRDVPGHPDPSRASSADFTEFEDFADAIAGAGLADVLRSDGFPGDPGFTSKPPTNTRGKGKHGWRLDYMLLRDGNPALCAHDVRTESFRTSTTSLSDHEAITTAFGADDEGCNAARAMRDRRMISRTSLSESAVEWYRYAKPGTYVVDVDVLGGEGRALRVEPFEETGRPARTLTGNGLSAGSGAPVVVASRGPLYLRMSEVDGLPVDYSLEVVPSNGVFASNADLGTAVALDPFHPYSFALPATASRVFRLSVVRPHSGEPIALTAETSDHPGSLLMRLLDPTGRELARGSNAVNLPVVGPPYERGNYFLVVDGGSAPSTPTITWETDVAILDLYKLWCEEQEDSDPGDDGIYLQVSIDGGRKIRVNLGDFDGEQAKFLPTDRGGIRFHNLAFRDRISITMREEDDDSRDDNLGTATFARSGSTVEVLRRTTNRWSTINLAGNPLGTGEQHRVDFTRDGADYRLFFWASSSAT